MLIGFRSKNHPQQNSKRGTIENVDDRALPAESFSPLNQRFEFTIDVAANAQNAKLPRYWTKETCGLSKSWNGERVYCNPPYSNIRPWVEKAWMIEADIAVLLLPANRTEQSWWQDLIEPFRDRGNELTTEFLQGRLRFLKPGQTSIGPNERPPFGCVLCIWKKVIVAEL